MIIALASPCVAASPNEGLDKVKTLLSEASAQGAEIVCFPEAYLPGLRGVDIDVLPFGPAEQERVLRAVGEWARTHSIAAILGTERPRFDAGRPLRRLRIAVEIDSHPIEVACVLIAKPAEECVRCSVLCKRARLQPARTDVPCTVFSTFEQPGAEPATLRIGMNGCPAVSLAVPVEGGEKGNRDSAPLDDPGSSAEVCEPPEVGDVSGIPPRLPADGAFFGANDVRSHLKVRRGRVAHAKAVRQRRGHRVCRATRRDPAAPVSAPVRSARRSD